MFSLLLILTPRLLSQVDLEIFAVGFTRPVAIANAGDNRLFVVEQPGRIIITDSLGNKFVEPFLDITAEVTDDGNEQGLLGLAFHPDYKENGYFFLNYTGPGGATKISRFSVLATNPNQADPESEKPVLTISQPFQNHNGGDLLFGPDGYLYIGTGDGGSAGDPGNRAQNPKSLLGKMLRIDVNNGDPYGIPESNPFTGDTTILDEIWALGLRNPWRFSFDHETGDLWIGDVGQNKIEEINFQPYDSQGGENYGWRCYEGSMLYNGTDCAGSEQYVFPVHEYLHDGPGGCSVTGGYVYRGKAFPSFGGSYFFTDYCTDRIWSLKDSSGIPIFSDHGKFAGNGFSTFGEDMDGELYVAGLSSGNVYRITAAEPVSATSESGIRPNRIYPNPSQGDAWISTDVENWSGSSVFLYDVEGKVVLTTIRNSNPFQLEMQSVPAGIYFLEVRDESGSDFHKLLKQE